MDCLPIATPYDPAEDPPGSIDPLGTVGSAEQLADVLLPGMTARMWRARHLTFTALSALIGERAAAAEGGSETMRLEARLGLERLFVSAIAGKGIKEEGWDHAGRRLPGIGLARRAIHAGHQPLGKQNFLKGQAVNGPFGVVQRLARNLDVIDDDNHLSRNGEELLLAWSAAQNLAGILDDTDANSPSAGANWLRRMMRSVLDHVKDGVWPNAGWWGWSDLADLLRPDQPNPRERQVLFRLLTGNSAPTRKRCIDLLLSPDVVQSYRTVLANGSRGELDREILVHQVNSQVRHSDDGTDRLIHYAVGLIDAHEQVSGYLEVVFRGLTWALTRRGGRGTLNELLADPVLSSKLISTRRKLTGAAKSFQMVLSMLGQHPHVFDAVNVERLDQLLQCALNGSTSDQGLVEAVMERHRLVQQQKRKGVWIEQELPHWTLMPGFGDNADAPWSHSGAFLHPFRVTNAYSFLSDLGKVRGVEVSDAEEE